MHEHNAGRLQQQAQLLQRLSERIGAASQPDPASVETVVRAVFSTMHGDLSGHETSVLAEVEELGRTIAAAKADIAALRVDDITDNHIPSATDELDAIVAHTASATDCILEVCETLDALSAEMTGKQAEQMAEATTRIYEACSFQDITGQRISKVVTALKAIDEKVTHILETFSARPPSRPAVVAAPPAPAPERLLNGPQLAMAAMDQSDIDKLLASFE